MIRVVHLCIFGLICCIATQVYAGIATDGTTGPLKTLSGPDYLIPQNLGTSVGGNLFHSFERFSIMEGESATFTGDNAVLNIISRVTGGAASNIDGLLRSEVGQADLFFINPAGVVFGPNARVDVPAAFHVSAADELRFEDGSVFSAAEPDKSNLSMAAPASFGYLSPQPASIVLNGSRLAFAPGSEVSLDGGDVAIKGGARVTVEGGTFQAIAVGKSESQADLTSGETNSEADGTILITEGSSVDVSGDKGGETLTLRAGIIQIDKSVIAADYGGGRNSTGKVHLKANSVGVLGSDVRARVFGRGAGGDIMIEANDLEISAAEPSSGFSRITTRVMDNASGNAGDIHLLVNSLSLKDGGSVSSFPQQLAAGSGGVVRVAADDHVEIKGSNNFGYYSGIFTTSYSEVGGHGGAIRIEAPDADVAMSEGAVLQTGTSGSGYAGSVEVEVNNFIMKNGSQIITESYSEGAAGDVEIKANGFHLIDNSSVLANAHGEGRAGNVDIFGNVALLDKKSFVEASTIGGGAAGHIAIKAGELNLLNESGILASSFGNGNGGDVNIDIVDSFAVENTSFVSTSTQSISDQAGKAGDIRITSPIVKIIDSGVIDSSTWNHRDGGDVSITASDILMNGAGNRTGVFSNVVFGSGSAGDISVLADGQVKMCSGGQIGSSTSGEGPAGFVSVEAGALSIHGGNEKQFCGIFSEARSGSSGASGEVQVKVDDRLELLQGGQISTSSSMADGSAGKVTVVADEVVINGENQTLPIATGILSRSVQSSGNGGNVEVVCKGRLEIIAGGQISTTAGLQAGNAGKTIVDAGEIAIDGKSVEIPTGIFSETKGSLSGDLAGKGGDVQAKASGKIQILNGGQISTSSGFGGEDAGVVSVEASELLIDGHNSTIASESTIGSRGNAGAVRVHVKERIEIKNLGRISSTTLTDHDAGDVRIISENIRIDSEGGAFCATVGSGDAGALTIKASGVVALMNAGTIRSDTFSSGDAGEIAMESDRLFLSRSAVISSSTEGAGDAGNVTIRTNGLIIDGTGAMEGETQIASLSAQTAEGFVGNVQIEARDVSVREGGKISIEGRQTLPGDTQTNVVQKQILIESESTTLDQSASISAESSGNTPSASIAVLSKELHVENNSRITTSSQIADGGDIAIGAQRLALRDGLITTSVEGLAGDGGDIDIGALSPDVSNVLILDGGFVQANTAAEGARGGDIFVDASAVIAGSGLLEVGGAERQVFKPGSGVNVIQAAAPGGEQGNIAIAAPNLDISGSLVNLSAGLSNPVSLATDLCLFPAGETPSALIFCKTGGLPDGPDGFSTTGLSKIWPDDL